MNENIQIQIYVLRIRIKYYDKRNNSKLGINIKELLCLCITSVILLPDKLLFHFI